MSESQFQLTALTEVARNLTETQSRILQALKDKGPGLLLEVAVRVMKFPEDVQEPLRKLQIAGLVTTQSVSGGQFAGKSQGDNIKELIGIDRFHKKWGKVAGRESVH